VANWELEGTLRGLGRSPQWGPGAKPLVGGSAWSKAPRKLKAFFVFGYPKEGPFFTSPQNFVNFAPNIFQVTSD